MRVYRGIAYFSQSRTLNITPRQQTILNLVALGLCNKDIATILKLSYRTIENHMYRIAERTNKRRRVELAVWWLTSTK